MAKDVVCGRDVDTRTRSVLEFARRTYYFCSDDCKYAFADDPARYAALPGERHRVTSVRWPAVR